MAGNTLFFLMRLARNPRQVSALAPSSRRLARAMAQGIGPHSGRIVEFGPGTGRLTEALLDAGVPAENLTCFELDSAFVAHIRRRFPGVNVIHAGAHEAAQHVEGGVSHVISGLPLLSMPVAVRLAILRGAREVLAEDGEMRQFTYGATAPLDPQHLHELGMVAVRGQYVPLNLPPARIFHFRPLRPAPDEAPAG